MTFSSSGGRVRKAHAMEDLERRSEQLLFHLRTPTQVEYDRSQSTSRPQATLPNRPPSQQVLLYPAESGPLTLLESTANSTVKRRRLSDHRPSSSKRAPKKVVYVSPFVVEAQRRALERSAGLLKGVRRRRRKAVNEWDTQQPAEPPPAARQASSLRQEPLQQAPRDAREVIGSNVRSGLRRGGSRRGPRLAGRSPSPTLTVTRNEDAPVPEMSLSMFSTPRTPRAGCNVPPELSLADRSVRSASPTGGAILSVAPQQGGGASVTAENVVWTRNSATQTGPGSGAMIGGPDGVPTARRYNTERRKEKSRAVSPIDPEVVRGLLQEDDAQVARTAGQKSQHSATASPVAAPAAANVVVDSRRSASTAPESTSRLVLRIVPGVGADDGALQTNLARSAQGAGGREQLSQGSLEEPRVDTARCNSDILGAIHHKLAALEASEDMVRRRFGWMAPTTIYPPEVCQESTQAQTLGQAPPPGAVTFVGPPAEKDGDGQSRHTVVPAPPSGLRIGLGLQLQNELESSRQRYEQHRRQCEARDFKSALPMEQMLDLLTKKLLGHLVDGCADELEALVQEHAEEVFMSL